MIARFSYIDIYDAKRNLFIYLSIFNLLNLVPRAFYRAGGVKVKRTGNEVVIFSMHTTFEIS